MPANDRFWDTYAHGTHQNWPVFAGRKQRGMTGRYVFKLSTRPVDARTRRTRKYVLVVTASDSAGNRSSRARAFSLDGV